MNIFQIILNAIKSRVTSILTRVRMWTNLSYIRTQVVNRLRNAFVGLFDVRPKHKNDYYGIFGWLVSKKLAFAVVIVIGVLSCWYLYTVHETLFGFGGSEQIKTYSYDSILLRFANSEVKITGKSGYLAYQGMVSKGGCNGSGTLYRPDGSVVYQGAFANSNFNGNGRLFYENSVLKYAGSFKDNLYDGSGKLYRSNASIAYDGEFSLGKKEGIGKLYDNGGNPIYEGAFSQDQLLYSDLLGKTAAEVSDAYRGEREIYTPMQAQGEEFYVSLKDIGCVYYGVGDSNALDDSVKIESIYVLSDHFSTGTKECRSIPEIVGVMGKPDYEGNSIVTMGEAIAINELNETVDTLSGKVTMETSNVLSDYKTIDGIDGGYSVYLYSFSYDGLIYTFVCSDKESEFVFYSLMKKESGEDAE